MMWKSGRKVQRHDIELSMKVEPRWTWKFLFGLIGRRSKCMLFRIYRDIDNNWRHITGLYLLTLDFL